MGTSKLLHFINPSKFAIWDSRVFRFLTNKELHAYRLDKPSLYLDYLKLCAKITNKPGYKQIHNSMCKKVGYKMTKFRTLELIMYLKGSKENARNKT